MRKHHSDCQEPRGNLVVLGHHVICVHLRIIVSEALVCSSMVIFRKEVFYKGL